MNALFEMRKELSENEVEHRELTDSIQVIIQGSNMFLTFPIQAAGMILAALIFGKTQEDVTASLANRCRVSGEKVLSDHLEQITKKHGMSYNKWLGNRALADMVFLLY